MYSMNPRMSEITYRRMVAKDVNDQIRKSKVNQSWLEMLLKHPWTLAIHPNPRGTFGPANLFRRCVEVLTYSGCSKNKIITANEFNYIGLDANRVFHILDLHKWAKYLSPNRMKLLVPVRSIRDRLPNVFGAIFRDVLHILARSEPRPIKPIQLFTSSISTFWAIEKCPNKKGWHPHLLVYGIFPHLAAELERLFFDEIGDTQVNALHDGSIPYLVDKFDDCYDYCFKKISPRH